MVRAENGFDIIRKLKTGISSRIGNFTDSLISGQIYSITEQSTYPLFR
jgi:hypothetical protein